MIDLHYWPTPNGWKISVMLEECGLPYRVHKVQDRPGRPVQARVPDDFAERQDAGHRRPRPARAAGAPLAIFESGAILLYLAEKSGRFMPPDLAGRVAVTQWLMWQVGGLGPMAGQNGHFLLYASEKLPYAIDRYGREVRRLYGVLDTQLGATGPLRRRRVLGRRYRDLSMDRHPQGARADPGRLPARQALVRRPSGRATPSSAASRSGRSTRGLRSTRRAGATLFGRSGAEPAEAKIDEAKIDEAKINEAAEHERPHDRISQEC